MSRVSVSIDVPQRHLTAGFPPDWMAVSAAGSVVIVHGPGDMGTTTYTLAATTTNPRVIASADALLWEGDVVKPSYEDGLVLLQHPHAGIQDRLVPAEFLDEPVQLLERTDLVTLTTDGGAE